MKGDRDGETKKRDEGLKRRDRDKEETEKER